MSWRRALAGCWMQVGASAAVDAGPAPYGVCRSGALPRRLAAGKHHWAVVCGDHWAAGQRTGGHCRRLPAIPLLQGKASWTGCCLDSSCRHWYLVRLFLPQANEAGVSLLLCRCWRATCFWETLRRWASNTACMCTQGLLDSREASCLVGWLCPSWPRRDCHLLASSCLRSWATRSKRPLSRPSAPPSPRCAGCPLCRPAES